MKIVIINPSLFPSLKRLHMGITILSSCVNDSERHGANVVDFIFHRKDWKTYLKESIEQARADVIGINCETPLMNYAEMMMQEIKDKYGLPIICGGVHVTLSPEGFLDKYPADAICLGEGEKTIVDYLDRLELPDKSLKGVNGLWFKNGNEVIRNELRGYLQDIETLPFMDWSLWENIERYIYFNGGSLPFIGTRGCVYNCSYCCTHALREKLPGRYFRMIPPSRLIDEIEFNRKMHYDKGFRVALIHDSCFTINKEWVNEFCEEYIRRGLDREIQYYVLSRADHLDDETVRVLSRSGCRAVHIGAEAGDLHIRKNVWYKDIDDDSFHTAVNLCKKHGIRVSLSFILGGPEETRQTIKKTVAFAKALNAKKNHFHIFSPFPGILATEMFFKNNCSIRDEKTPGDNNVFIDNYKIDVSPDLTYPRLLSIYKRTLIRFFLKRQVDLLIKRKWGYIAGLVGNVYYGIKWKIPLIHVLMVYSEYGKGNILE